MTETMRVFKEQGVAHVEIMTHADSVKHHRFYEKFGLQTVRVHGTILAHSTHTSLPANSP